MPITDSSRRRCTAFLASVALVGGIVAAAFPSRARSQALPPEWGTVWLNPYPGDEPPPWCLELHAGGKAEFIGEPLGPMRSLLALNPVSWKRDPESGDLALTFAALSDLMATNLQWQLDHATKSRSLRYARLTGFDKSTRTVRYRIVGETRFISLGGTVMARPEEVAPENFVGLPADCWSGPPPRRVEPEETR